MTHRVRITNPVDSFEYGNKNAEDDQTDQTECCTCISVELVQKVMACSRHNRNIPDKQHEVAQNSVDLRNLLDSLFLCPGLVTVIKSHHSGS